jgi:hypothetical protein
MSIRAAARPRRTNRETCCRSRCTRLGDKERQIASGQRSKGLGELAADRDLKLRPGLHLLDVNRAATIA